MCAIYIEICISYRKISSKYYKNIVSYENKVLEYRSEYNDIVNKIDSLLEVENNDTKDVLLVYNELNGETDRLKDNNSKLSSQNTSLNEQKKC